MQHRAEVLPASTSLQNVEIGIPADNQVAVACGYMTRAKHSLAHITLDELEQTLPLPDEKLLPLEDGEEYQYFLEVKAGRHAWHGWPCSLRPYAPKIDQSSDHQECLYATH